MLKILVFRPVFCFVFVHFFLSFYKFTVNSSVFTVRAYTTMLVRDVYVVFATSLPETFQKCTDYTKIVEKSFVYILRHN